MGQVLENNFRFFPIKLINKYKRSLQLLASLPFSLRFPRAENTLKLHTIHATQILY